MYLAMLRASKLAMDSLMETQRRQAALNAGSGEEKIADGQEIFVDWVDNNDLVC